MKKFLYTVILMSIGVIGFMYFSKPVKALIYETNEYRDLETEGNVEINNNNYYPVFIDDYYFGGSFIVDWLLYVENNNIEIFEIQAQSLSRFYLYNDNNFYALASDVFKIRLVLDVEFRVFRLELYHPNDFMISFIDLYEWNDIEGDWLLPINTMILSSVEHIPPYKQGFNEGYNVGLENGYEVGYDDAFYEYAYETDNGSWVSADTWGNIRYDDGLDDGYNDGYNSARNEFGYNDNGTIIPAQGLYDRGYNDAIQETGSLKAEIINFVPGVLGSIFMFFFQLGQIGILGITILDILGMLVLISGLIFLIKFFF